MSGPIRVPGDAPNVADDVVDGTAGCCAETDEAIAHTTLTRARIRTAAPMPGSLARTVAVAPNRNLLTSETRRAHVGDDAVGQRLGNVHQ